MSVDDQRHECVRLISLSRYLDRSCGDPQTVCFLLAWPLNCDVRRPLINIIYGIGLAVIKTIYNAFHSVAVAILHRDVSPNRTLLWNATDLYAAFKTLPTYCLSNVRCEFVVDNKH